jgi:predicted nucleic acid-binding protein
MRFSADSSAIVRLYDPQANTREVASLHRFLDEDKVLSLPDLARVEVLNVLLRPSFRDHYGFKPLQKWSKRSRPFSIFARLVA